ncbi:MAG TPA: hypothetical protein PLL66_01795 [Bacteroidales bacterium]|nr:hypothetical protein [Bacteroidales bacterium]
MKIASIDIGTNTCNLLIAEYRKNSPIKFIYKEKRAITLINKDYKNNVISEESASNLIHVLNTYKLTISLHKTKRVLAVATSGIRSSYNKDSVINRIKETSGFNVNVIDGVKETELIWKGVKNAVKIYSNPALIIDIGGGSIEFILCNDKGIIRKSSHDIGVARMMNNYNFSDPLSNENLSCIYQLLDNELKDLLVDCKKYNLNTLIGSSGSYETFANLIKHEFSGCSISDSDLTNILEIEKFLCIYKKLILFNEAERAKMPGMEIIRVKMIPIAAVITKYLLDNLNIRNFVQSNFSLKEGTLFDYIDSINNPE